MFAKGEMERRLKEIDAEMLKFSETRASLKADVMKDTSSLMDNRLSSFSDYKKTEITDAKKALKGDMLEMRDTVTKLLDKLERLNEKTNATREDLVTVKRARVLVIENVKSISKTVEENVDVRLRDFMKDMEKRMRTQEAALNSKMETVEKKVASVSESVSKANKEKEEQLEELLRHVES